MLDALKVLFTTLLKSCVLRRLFKIVVINMPQGLPIMRKRRLVSVLQMFLFTTSKIILVFSALMIIILTGMLNLLHVMNAQLISITIRLLTVASLARLAIFLVWIKRHASLADPYKVATNVTLMSFSTTSKQRNANVKAKICLTSMEKSV